MLKFENYIYIAMDKQDFIILLTKLTPLADEIGIIYTYYKDEYLWIIKDAFTKKIIGLYDYDPFPIKDHIIYVYPIKLITLEESNLCESKSIFYTFFWKSRIIYIKNTSQYSLGLYCKNISKKLSIIKTNRGSLNIILDYFPWGVTNYNFKINEIHEGY